MKRSPHRALHRSRQLETLENRMLLATDFTLVAMSDTQYTVESFPATFSAQTQWAADHASDPAYNVAFVAHQGDMLRRGYSNSQAANADAALDLLNGIVPYTADIGNHDFDNQFDDLDHHISSANFTSWFGDARYQNIPGSGFGGSSLDQRNRYSTFTAAGQTYMVMSLEWEAPDSALAWAQGVIDAHRQIPVILTTHEYLNSGGRTTSPLDPLGNSGQAIFDKLVKLNPQIFLVLSGHTGSVRHQTSTNLAGSTVFETTGDFESRPHGGDGYLQLFQFDSAGGAINIASYSPTLNQFDTSSSSYQFSLPLNFATRFVFSDGPAPLPPPPNTAPTGAGESAATGEGKAVTVNVLANDFDAEGDAIKPILTSLPAHGAVFPNTNGSITYTPDPKYTGEDTFTYVVSDGKAVSAVFQTTVTITPAVTGTIAYDYPIAETTVRGTRSGSYSNLAASDGVEETITEVSVSGSAVIDQQWQFNVTGGTDVAFAIRAKRSWGTTSSGDEYHFRYSTNGSTWSDMTQYAPASSRDVTRVLYDADEPYQMWALPAATRGTVWIRATDTKSFADLCSLTVDEMFIRSVGVTPITIPNAPSALAVSYNSGNKKASLSWADNSANETGFNIWYSLDNGTTWQLFASVGANATSYTTSALTKNKTYKFKVGAYNTAGESFSNIVTVNT